MLKHNDCIGACCIVQALPYPTVWQSWRIACYEVHQPLSSRLRVHSAEVLRSRMCTFDREKRACPGRRSRTSSAGGVDKLPLEERYQWAADNVPQIFEAAENPVHGSRWWMQVRDAAAVVSPPTLPAWGRSMSDVASLQQATRTQASRCCCCSTCPAAAW